MLSIHTIQDHIKAPIVQNARLSEFTTFRLGGRCPLLISCQRLQEIQNVIQYFYAQRMENYIVIGEGSNLLVSDDGIQEHVIRYFSKTAHFERDGEEIIVEACSRLDHLAFVCAKQGLAGLGFASGIPGSVGGAVVGNAGAFGHEMGEFTQAVDVLDTKGRVRTLGRHNCAFSYRQSHFKDSKDIILSVRLKLKEGSAPTLLEERKKILLERRAKHPNYHTVPCAGSFFKNIKASDPFDRRQAAGWFLDQIGAKQMLVGGAGVFEKHANILIKKTPLCTASDVSALSKKREQAVLEKFGIVLEREVRLLGSFTC